MHQELPQLSGPWAHRGGQPQLQSHKRGAAEIAQRSRVSAQHQARRWGRG